MAKWECPNCETLNAAPNHTCEICGEEKLRQRGSSQTPARCWVDGTALDPTGFCAAGGGYPLGTRCPFVCPHCRHALTWDGACFGCHGTATGQSEDWAFPGDRYERDRQHYVKTDAGPRPACSMDERRRLIALIRTRLYLLGAGR